MRAIRAGDRRAIARTITRIESTRDADRDLGQAILDALVADSGRAIRVGITGPPGVGKSTFVEALGLMLVEQGKRVAVLAVDPSSPVTGGSILGDKTRMERLAVRPEAFIRPSPSGGSLGGVAHRTREVMLLCEAAGFDVVLIETVGIGQSEVAVASMVDFFLVLLLPAGGRRAPGHQEGRRRARRCAGREQGRRRDGGARRAHAPRLLGRPLAAAPRRRRLAAAGASSRARSNPGASRRSGPRSSSTARCSKPRASS